MSGTARQNHRPLDDYPAVFRPGASWGILGRLAGFPPLLQINTLSAK